MVIVGMIGPGANYLFSLGDFGLSTTISIILTIVAIMVQCSGFGML